MIIKFRDDVVQLSGAIRKNQWPAIRSAIDMLIATHSLGVIIDFTQVTYEGDAAEQTLVNAHNNYCNAPGRFILVNVPTAAKLACAKSGAEDHVSLFAESVEAARACLRDGRRAGSAARSDNVEPGHRQGGMLVPLFAGLNFTHGAYLAARLARTTRGIIHLVYFLEVSRTLPLNAPLLEKEQNAQSELAAALAKIDQHNCVVIENIERVRDATEGILAAIKLLDVDMVVLGASGCDAVQDGSARFRQIADALLNRATVEVVIGRPGQTS